MYVQCLSYMGWINKFLNIYIYPMFQAFLILPIPATLPLSILPSGVTKIWYSVFRFHSLGHPLSLNTGPGKPIRLLLAGFCFPSHLSHRESCAFLFLIESQLLLRFEAAYVDIEKYLLNGRLHTKLADR